MISVTQTSHFTISVHFYLLDAFNSPTMLWHSNIIAQQDWFWGGEIDGGCGYPWQQRNYLE